VRLELPGATELRVVFDRTNADGRGDDGTAVTLAGRTAYVEPPEDGDADCQVAVVYRDYLGARGDRIDELMLVDVDNSKEKPQQLCAQAQRLATTVAQRLAS
jgi:hypothetical protein